MFVYILYSPELDSYYTGFCQSDLSDRISKHISGFYIDSYTQKASDWELAWNTECEDTHQALCIFGITDTPITGINVNQYIFSMHP